MISMPENDTPNPMTPENTPSEAENQVTSADMPNDTPSEAENQADTPNDTPSDHESDGESAENKADAANKVAFDASPKMRKDAKVALKDAMKLYKAGKGKIDKDAEQNFVAASQKLKESLDSAQGVDLAALATVKKIASTALKPFEKSATREVFESLMFALVFALILRTFFIEPFKIPTRSMVPTLLEGDQLFVTKLSYGIRLPILNKYVAHFSDVKRGDVVVFAFPQQEAAEHLARTNSLCMRPEALVGEKDYIKRVIGVEGDRIEVINQVVLVNGEPINSTPYYQHTVINKFGISDRREGYWNHVRHGDAEFTTMTHQLPETDSHFGPIVVKPGHFFAMGDNRDNSLDSRCWGQVPVDNIKGRAQIIWWSSGTHGLRANRMFSAIH